MDPAWLVHHPDMDRWDSPRIYRVITVQILLPVWAGVHSKPFTSWNTASSWPSKTQRFQFFPPSTAPPIMPLAMPSQHTFSSRAHTARIEVWTPLFWSSHLHSPWSA